MNTAFTRVGLLSFLAVAIAACGDVGDAPKAKTGEKVEVEQSGGKVLTIDTAKSKVDWKAAKVTKAHDGGFDSFGGTVTVNEGKIASVDVTIQTPSIFSDTEKLTGHLKSPDFFDVEKYPTATFEASSFQEQSDTAGNTHLVTGNLTMHGVTHSITFPAKINVTDGGVTAQADFIINRKDWGIVYTGAPDDLIRDDVRILLDIVAGG